MPPKNIIMDIQKFQIEWGDKPLIIETGRFAEQAGGSCLVQYGETVVLGTATMSENKREGIDFFPLMVDYEEKMYAAGKIKGSRFIKKEGRPTDEAILTCRMIDRAIRPLFNETMRNEVQIVTTVLAFDKINDGDVPATIAAVTALSISNVPWDGLIGGIRVGQVDGEFIVNPTYEEREKSTFEVFVAGTDEKTIMLEASANQVDEKTITEAIEFGQENLKAVIDLIQQVKDKLGKEKTDVTSPKTDEEKNHQAEIEKTIKLSEEFLKDKANTALFDAPKVTKTERRAIKKQITEELAVFLKEKEIDANYISFGLAHVYGYFESVVSREILENERRVDGRSLTEVRNLYCEVGILPRVHGTGHFKRGGTQVFSVITLGPPSDELLLDGMEESGSRRYMHHYYFPSYSVGEARPNRGPGRREIGHGALAEKALIPVLPSKEEFPYTVRVVSEVFSSNGSSSMGSTCGSTLALMDAGVPISDPVAGVAMGIATNDKGDYKIITDIQDLEDGKGGMDFKVTGTRKGITSIQLDTKTTGLSKEIVRETLTRAKDGRFVILDAMEAAIDKPRPELSPNAPKITTFFIKPDKIRTVIGPGGKVINEIIEATGVAIDLEDDGQVLITSTDQEGAKRAEEWIKDLVREAVVGETYKGKVVRLMDFGAFVEILPGKDGLVHVSKLAPYHVAKVEDIVKEGDEVNVKVTEIDNMGRINLSMKDAPGNTYPERPPQSNNGRNDNRPDRQGPKKRGFFKKK